MGNSACKPCRGSSINEKTHTQNPAPSQIVEKRPVSVKIDQSTISTQKVTNEKPQQKFVLSLEYRILNASRVTLRNWEAAINDLSFTLPLYHTFDAPKPHQNDWIGLRRWSNIINFGNNAQIDMLTSARLVFDSIAPNFCEQINMLKHMYGNSLLDLIGIQNAHPVNFTLPSSNTASTNDNNNRHETKIRLPYPDDVALRTIATHLDTRDVPPPQCPLTISSISYHNLKELSKALPSSSSSSLENKKQKDILLSTSILSVLNLQSGAINDALSPLLHSSFAIWKVVHERHEQRIARGNRLVYPPLGSIIDVEILNWKVKSIMQTEPSVRSSVSPTVAPLEKGRVSLTCGLAKLSSAKKSKPASSAASLDSRIDVSVVSRLVAARLVSSAASTPSHTGVFGLFELGEVCRAVACGETCTLYVSSPSDGALHAIRLKVRSFRRVDSLSSDPPPKIDVLPCPSPRCLPLPSSAGLLVLPANTLRAPIHSESTTANLDVRSHPPPPLETSTPTPPPLVTLYTSNGNSALASIISRRVSNAIRAFPNSSHSSSSSATILIFNPPPSEGTRLSMSSSSANTVDSTRPGSASANPDRDSALLNAMSPLAGHEHWLVGDVSAAVDVSSSNHQALYRFSELAAIERLRTSIFDALNGVAQFAATSLVSSMDSLHFLLDLAAQETMALPEMLAFNRDRARELKMASANLGDMALLSAVRTLFTHPICIRGTVVQSIEDNEFWRYVTGDARLSKETFWHNIDVTDVTAGSFPAGIPIGICESRGYRVACIPLIYNPLRVFAPDGLGAGKDGRPFTSGITASVLLNNQPIFDNEAANSNLHVHQFLAMALHPFLPPSSFVWNLSSSSHSLIASSKESKLQLKDAKTTSNEGSDPSTNPFMLLDAVSSACVPLPYPAPLSLLLTTASLESSTHPILMPLSALAVSRYLPRSPLSSVALATSVPCRAGNEETVECDEQFAILNGLNVSIKYLHEQSPISQKIKKSQDRPPRLIAFAVSGNSVQHFLSPTFRVSSFSNDQPRDVAGAFASLLWPSETLRMTPYLPASRLPFSAWSKSERFADGVFGISASVVAPEETGVDDTDEGDAAPHSPVSLMRGAVSPHLGNTHKLKTVDLSSTPFRQLCATASPLRSSSPYSGERSPTAPFGGDLSPKMVRGAAVAARETWAISCTEWSDCLLSKASASLHWREGRLEEEGSPFNSPTAAMASQRTGYQPASSQNQKAEFLVDMFGSKAVLYTVTPTENFNRHQSWHPWDSDRMIAVVEMCEETGQLLNGWSPKFSPSFNITSTTSADRKSSVRYNDGKSISFQDVLHPYTPACAWSSSLQTANNPAITCSIGHEYCANVRLAYSAFLSDALQVGASVSPPTFAAATQASLRSLIKKYGLPKSATLWSIVASYIANVRTPADPSNPTRMAKLAENAACELLVAAANRLARSSLRHMLARSDKEFAMIIQALLGSGAWNQQAHSIEILNMKLVVDSRESLIAVSLAANLAKFASMSPMCIFTLDNTKKYKNGSDSSFAPMTPSNLNTLIPLAFALARANPFKLFAAATSKLGVSYPALITSGFRSPSHPPANLLLAGDATWLAMSLQSNSIRTIPLLSKPTCDSQVSNLLLFPSAMHARHNSYEDGWAPFVRSASLALAANLIPASANYAEIRNFIESISSVSLTRLPTFACIALLPENGRSGKCPVVREVRKDHADEIDGEFAVADSVGYLMASAALLTDSPAQRSCRLRLACISHVSSLLKIISALPLCKSSVRKFAGVETTQKAETQSAAAIDTILSWLSAWKDDQQKLMANGNFVPPVISVMRSVAQGLTLLVDGDCSGAADQLSSAFNCLELFAGSLRSSGNLTSDGFLSEGAASQSLPITPANRILNCVETPSLPLSQLVIWMLMNRAAAQGEVKSFLALSDMLRVSKIVSSCPLPLHPPLQVIKHTPSSISVLNTSSSHHALALDRSESVSSIQNLARLLTSPRIRLWFASRFSLADISFQMELPCAHVDVASLVKQEISSQASFNTSTGVTDTQRIPSLTRPRTPSLSQPPPPLSSVSPRGSASNPANPILLAVGMNETGALGLGTPFVPPAAIVREIRRIQREAQRGSSRGGTGANPSANDPDLAIGELLSCQNLPVTEEEDDVWWTNRPALIPAVTANAVSLSSGANHSLLVDANGLLYSWGANSRGQVGTVCSPDGTCPSTLVGLSSRDGSYTLLSSAPAHSPSVTFLTSRLDAANANKDGKFATADRSSLDSAPLPADLLPLVPPFIPSPHTINLCLPVYFRQVACGQDFSTAIDVNDNLWTWGANDRGQLGLGDKIDRLLPTQFDSALSEKCRSNAPWLSVLRNNVKSVACGTVHALAVTLDGMLLSWGAADAAQLGFPLANARWLAWDEMANADIHGRPIRDHSRRMPPHNAVGVHCLYPQLLTLKLKPLDTMHSLDPNEEADGLMVECTFAQEAKWINSLNGLGQFIPSSRRNQNSLMGQNAISTSVSAVPLSATSNNLFSLAHPATSPVITPISISNSSNVPRELLFNSVACGDAHCIALSSDGTVLSWGNGQFGQLGLGFCADDYPLGQGSQRSVRDSPRRILAKSFAVSIQTDSTSRSSNPTSASIASIAAGGATSAAIDSLGNLFTWGCNDRRQTGHPTEAVTSPGGASNPNTSGKQPSRSLVYGPEIRCPMHLCSGGLKNQIVKSVSLGGDHGVCNVASGSIFSWGSAHGGALSHSELALAVGSVIHQQGDAEIPENKQIRFAPRPVYSNVAGACEVRRMEGCEGVKVRLIACGQNHTVIAGDAS